MCNRSRKAKQFCANRVNVDRIPVSRNCRVSSTKIDFCNSDRKSHNNERTTSVRNSPTVRPNVNPRAISGDCSGVTGGDGDVLAFVVDGFEDWLWKNSMRCSANHNTLSFNELVADGVLSTTVHRTTAMVPRLWYSKSVTCAVMVTVRWEHRLGGYLASIVLDK
jgi:hypothetical protein